MAREQEEKKVIDERPLMEKLAGGDIRAVHAGDAAGVTSTIANVASNFGGLVNKGYLGPVMGNTLPFMDAVGVAADGIKGSVEATAEYERISHRFGNFKQLARRIPAFRQKQLDLDLKAQRNMLESAVSAVGGLAGGAAVGALVGAIAGSPVPIIGPITGVAIGGVVGAIGGSIVSNKIYNKTCVEQAQDPVIITEQMCQMRDAGQAVPKELVFAALAANLTGRDGKRVDKLLKRYTGTTLFTEALADEKNFAKLSAMMNDQGVRTAIRAKTNLPRDLQDPMLSVSEQYTQAINSGVLDPSMLLDNAACMACMSPHTIPSAAARTPLEVPLTPGIERPVTRSV